MQYHLRKALQKIDNQVEKLEHAEYDGEGIPTDEEIRQMIHDHGLVAAELFISALQLSEIGEFDLTGAVRDLWARNARHFIPDSAFAQLEQETYTQPISKR